MKLKLFKYNLKLFINNLRELRQRNKEKHRPQFIEKKTYGNLKLIILKFGQFREKGWIQFIANSKFILVILKKLIEKVREAGMNLV